MQFLLISKRWGYPSIHGIYNRGPYNQSYKVYESIKSITEHKDGLGKIDIQSNKVLKIINLRLGIVFSVSSKLRLFLSLHIHHIKDCGAAIPKWPFQWLRSYVVYAAYSWQFCISEKKRNYENKYKGVLVTKWTNALGELLTVNFEIRLGRNFKGHRILLTEFDLEEQNIDIQCIVDS